MEKRSYVAWVLPQFIEMMRRAGGDAVRRKHFRGLLVEGDV